MVRNPYIILGIREGASLDEIKRAYRKKAKEYHPDLHPDDPKANEKMQQVNEAYDMLCNPDKYRVHSQARPNSNAGYTSQNRWAGYANQGHQSHQGNWQYTWYSDRQNPWEEWQKQWSRAFSEQHSNGIIHPFRGLFRIIGDILLFRFFISLLSFGLFRFFS